MQRYPWGLYPVSTRISRWAAASAVAGAIAFAAAPGRAESIVKQPGNHYKYALEFEPHLLLGWANVDANDPFPRHIDFNRNAGFGPGLRLSIPLVDNGFVKSINNNVALGLGVDWAHYDANANVLWFPVVMQWNFFLTDVITVFGEPGIAFRTVSGNRNTDLRLDGVLQLGAKFMFSRNIGLTLRAGYPYFSLGLTVLI